jgi:hypothetical protein
MVAVKGILSIILGAKAETQIMPRLAKLDAPGVLHHVMGRGIEKRKIFRNDRDRNDLLVACQL